LREFGSIRASVAGAVLFSLAPFFFFNGIIALSYACEAAASVGFAWLAWRVRRAPSLRGFVGLGILWSASVGLRQSLFFFLTPLFAATLLSSPRGHQAVVRRTAAAAAAATAATAAWFIPMILLTSGGFKGWFGVTQHQSKYTVFFDTFYNRGWPSLIDKVQRLQYYLHFEKILVVVLAGTVLAVAVVRLVRRDARPPGRIPWDIAGFFAIWILPSLLFYATVYDGQGHYPPGYILVLLPGLYGAWALAMDALLRDLEAVPARPWAPRMWTALAIPILMLPAPALANDWDHVYHVEVQSRDDWAANWAQLPNLFPSNDTAILSWGSWGHARYYFPDYVVWGYFPNRNLSGPDWFYVAQSRHHVEDLPPRWPPDLNQDIPSTCRHIVLVDFQLAGENGTSRRIDDNVTIHEAHLANGWRILYFDVDGNHTTINAYIKNLERAYV
jgi:hypothetical protein